MSDSSKEITRFARWKEKFFATKFDYYQEEICNRNYKSFREFTVAGSFISFCILMMGLSFPQISMYKIVFLCVFSYFILLYLFVNYRFQQDKQCITPFFYLALTPLMITAILLGTYWDPEKQAVIILVFYVPLRYLCWISHGKLFCILQVLLLCIWSVATMRKNTIYFC